MPRPELRLLFLLLLLLGSATSLLMGCVSKAAARAQAHAAYAAGQQEALARTQQAQQASGPTITLNGEVTIPVIPWTPEMTLARALVAAEYHGPPEPGDILIVRTGRAIRIDPKQLLNGQDVPLLPGDIIDIRSAPVQPQPQ